MSTVAREATSTWRGDLAQGRGRVVRGAAGAGEAMSWDARVGVPGGATNPEELIAAAHAGCFSMALAAVLGDDGHSPDELDVRASCALDPVALRITEIELVVRGRVRGLDAAAFADAADRAERLCPVSNALRGNVTVTVVPQLVAA